MSNKGKGINFEREVKQYFEKKGYFVVRQSASLFPDLIVFMPIVPFKRKILAVECKINGQISSFEKARLKKLQADYGLTPFLAYKKNNKILLSII